MNKLEYYFVPADYIFFSSKQNEISVDNLSSYVSRAQRIQHGFIYKQNEEIRKYVNITEGELLELFAGPESKPYLVDCHF